MKRSTLNLIALSLIALVVGSITYLSAGMRASVWNEQAAVVLKATDTVAGIDTGRVATFDSTVAARTLVRVKAGVSDTSRREWILFKPNLRIHLDSTGKTRATFTIDSLSGQYPDSGFRFNYVTAAYPGTRQSGFVNWKYTIYSDSTSYLYNSYGTGSATPVRGGNITDTVMYSTAYLVPVSGWYQWHPKLWSLSNRDSTMVTMSLQTRVGDHPYAGWVTLATLNMADTTLDTSKWVSMPRLANADTAAAKFGHIGDYFRTVVTITDSNSAVINYGKKTSCRVLSDLIYIE